ncbi:MAG TPA: outer membrane beta-barrel protein [Steroidobacteraceae bacterium]|nr:outer membrane beta-barrel protein [Steroidobacteraceae bacterium]
MKKELTYLAAASLGLMSLTSTAFADEEVKAAPSLSSVLEASGITATGYVAASFYDQTADTASHQFDTLHDSYQLDQAAFTLAYQPKEGFGALVNVVAGQDARLINAATSGNTSSADSSPYSIAQAYVQYVGGPVTIIAGKYATLAGAEVFAPTGNANYSRSLLFFNEPLLHTGVRATVAVNDVFGFSLGVNNGWNYDTSSTSKTAEVGISLTPSKKFALTAQGYSGEDPNGLAGTGAGKRTFFDLVATINATDSLSFVVSYDNGKQESDASLVSDFKWDGIAAYVNVQFTDQWRLSVRGETMTFKQDGNPDVKQSEVTATVGFAPVKSFELRAEVRQDMVDKINGVGIFDKVFDGPGALTDPTDNGTEFALQGVYKF